MPWTSEYERAQAVVVGSILTGQTVPPNLRDGLAEEHFGSETWRKAFCALMALFEATGEVAYPDAMKAFDLEGLMTCEFLERLHSAEEESYGLRVTEWPVRVIHAEAERLGLLSLVDTAGQKLAGGMASRDVAVEMQRGLSRVVQDRGKTLEPTVVAGEVFDAQEARANGQETSSHIMTGWPSVDGELRGLAPGEVTLISGPTGHGKTSVAVSWLHEISVQNQVPAVFISLEMSLQGVMDRFVARASGHTLGNLWDGVMDGNVTRAIDAIHNSGLSVTDNSPRTITQILAIVEREALNRGSRLFVLDYIAEVVPDRKRKDEERNDQMYSRWVRALRQVAVTHGVHGVILCQNNKEGDLAESKSMSHVADFWFHFWRDHDGGHHFQVRKARRGPVGQVYRVRFDPAHQIMRELGRE